MDDQDRYPATLAQNRTEKEQEEVLNLNPPAGADPVTDLRDFLSIAHSTYGPDRANWPVGIQHVESILRTKALLMPTKARELYEEGFGATATRTIGILALPRHLAVEGEKVPYLRGVVESLRRTLEAAEQDLAAAEQAQDRAVSIREEYDSVPPESLA